MEGWKQQNLKESSIQYRLYLIPMPYRTLRLPASRYFLHITHKIIAFIVSQAIEEIWIINALDFEGYIITIKANYIQRSKFNEIIEDLSAFIQQITQ